MEVGFVYNSFIVLVAFEFAANLSLKAYSEKFVFGLSLVEIFRARIFFFA